MKVNGLMPVHNARAKGLLLLKTICFCGLFFWVGLAVLNNVVDGKTNERLLTAMISMSALKQDPAMGNGLENRAWNPSAAETLLRGVIVYQIVVITTLLIAALSYARALLHPIEPSVTRARWFGNIAISALMIMLFFFLSGGMWFGYWIKMGAVQGVHLTLLIMVIAIGVLNNTDA